MPADAQSLRPQQRFPLWILAVVVPAAGVLLLCCAGGIVAVAYRWGSNPVPAAPEKGAPIADVAVDPNNRGEEQRPSQSGNKLQAGNTLVVNIIDVRPIRNRAMIADRERGVSRAQGGTEENRARYRLKIGVTPTHEDKNPLTKKVVKWDDMGKLLLGMGYPFDVITPQEILQNPKRLAEYDVIFFPCAPGGAEIAEALRDYVSNEGILYASDWRYEAVAAAFPDMVDPKIVGKGDVQQLEADIVDPALREIIGPKIKLKFSMDQWKTAGFGGSRVQTLIRSRYRNMKKQLADAPLMVKFNFGKGTAIFTSFHNEEQNSKDEEKLLKYLIFRLVTAGVDTEVKTTMDQSGFTVQGSNLLNMPKKNQSISKTFENKNVGSLRFAIGFRDEGAKMRFTIGSPDGKQFTWEGTSSVILEVPSAVAGTWTYTITDLELPYEYFPFTVTVGEKN
jgi:hypothetical protein